MQPNYKKLIVWQKSMELVVEIYRITENYPASEVYGLTSQSRRCVVSIPSNIAEGRQRGSEKEFYRFLSIAFGSAAELETQLEIAKRLPFGENIDFTKADNLLDEVMKMLRKLLQKTFLVYF